MNRPRKQTYTMDMYLNKIKDMDIRNDSDTQRQFVWSNEQINELIVTILTEDYVPPIILGEVDNSQLWIVDGGQRSSSFNMFRYGNYKITSAIENSIIPYKKKVISEQGEITWEDDTFDIKNKTYDKLPEELKKKFNEYQIETAIHENCDARRIAQLIKRYNNHTSMNSNQKAFTYVDNFAREVRNILDSRFFLDCGTYTEKERSKGVLERVVLESVMCVFHFDQWKKQPKQVASFLNTNATKEEFDEFNESIGLLEDVVDDRFKDMFNSKDSFIWFTIFNKFLGLGIEKEAFADFLAAFKDGLKREKVNGVSFDDLDRNKGTKDRTVIAAKLETLTYLMLNFFNINQECLDNTKILEFVQENVSDEITIEDTEFYVSIVDDLTKNVNNKVALTNNKPSLTAIVAYACAKDVDLDRWIGNCLDKILYPSCSQKENYIYMKQDLDNYLKEVGEL